jgi:chemotaxis protein MotB
VARQRLIVRNEYIMFLRANNLSVLMAVLLVLSGCVAKSDYLREEAVADALRRNVADLKMENQGLRERINGLQKNIAALQDEISDLRAVNENLTTERNVLNVRLNSLRTEMNRAIQELQNRHTELEGDKQMLEESIALLKTSKYELMNRKSELEAEKLILEENLATLKKTNEELSNRNIELENDKQTLEESLTLLKESKEEENLTPPDDSKEEETSIVSGTYDDLTAEMKGEIEQGQIAITELLEKLTMNIQDKILFDPGRAEIKPSGLSVLKRIVKILMTVTDKLIRVEGHTDNVPIKGALSKKYPTNWEFSAARALNVTRYLEKEGIDPSLISAAAFGEHQPAVDNDTPEGRAKNRRIAIILLPMK